VFYIIRLKILIDVTGFTDGEGCFLINIYRSKTTKLGEAVQLIFKLTQHSRDEQLLISLAEFLNCGKVHRYKNKETVDLIITKFSYLNEKIIPFFKKFPIIGSKSLDFSDFEQVAKLMENKIHLTAEEFKQISASHK